MGIDLVVASLSTDWSSYADSALPLLASLDRLVPFGEPRPAYDRGWSERAFRSASPAEQSGSRASVSRAVGALQGELSSRFDIPVTWLDTPGVEEYLGQIDPRAALAVNKTVQRLGVDRFPNLAVLDIENMYLPVELPTVLVGQPRAIGAAPALAREVEAVSALVDPEDYAVLDHLSALREACELSARLGAVVLVSG